MALAPKRSTRRGDETVAAGSLDLCVCSDTPPPHNRPTSVSIS
jgi:hypothetical protein